MAFCINCGKELTEAAKFCPNCGTAVNSKSTTQRKTVYDGEIHKCPNCGDVINALVVCCPSCGYEIRGAVSSDSVYSFSEKLLQVTDEEQRILLLRSYPIPNTKEDIFEFMILASSNINQQKAAVQSDRVIEAWFAKFEQSYQKALLLFKDDSDFSKIQRIYDDGCKMRKNSQIHKNVWGYLRVFARNIPVFIGIAMVVAAVITDKMVGSSEIYELIGYLTLIISAATLPRHKRETIDYVIAALSGLVTIIASALLFNGSMAILCGGIILIIVAINFSKRSQKNQNKE